MKLDRRKEMKVLEVELDIYPGQKSCIFLRPKKAIKMIAA